MHIGFLTPEYPDSQRPDGGLGNYIRKIALELLSHGNEVTVFVLSSENKSWDDQGINIFQIKSFRFHWRLRKITSLSAILCLIEQWINSNRLKSFVLIAHSRRKIDLLQTSNYLAPGYALCQNGLIPLVCRCSSYMPSLRAANGQRRTFKNTIEDWREISIMLKAEVAFAPSEFVVKLYERFEGFRPRVIRTPVVLPSVTQDENIYDEFLKRKKYLLCFGTLMGVKGTDLLIKIAPRMLENFPDLNLAFVGGNGPIPSGGNAVELIQSELGAFTTRVYYHSPLQRSQLYPIIQNAFGVVMPSRVDNYPNACLEAFALGVPVIGTYESSLEEIIIDGKTGFLARNNDPESLYEAVERLINLKEYEILKMKENIRITMDSFLAEDRVGQLIELYKETIANFDPKAMKKHSSRI